jgi:hypothetical protein
LVGGRYWHHLRQEQPAAEAADPEFQDQLIAKSGELTGVALPRTYLDPSAAPLAEAARVCRSHSQFAVQHSRTNVCCPRNSGAIADDVSDGRCGPIETLAPDRTGATGAPYCLPFGPSIACQAGIRSRN